LAVFSLADDNVSGVFVALVAPQDTVAHTGVHAGLPSSMCITLKRSKG